MASENKQGSRKRKQSKPAATGRKGRASSRSRDDEQGEHREPQHEEAGDGDGGESPQDQARGDGRGRERTSEEPGDGRGGERGRRRRRERAGLIGRLADWATTSARALVHAVRPRHDESQARR